MILPGPLEPTGGWALFGFWGAGGVAAIFALTLLTAQRWIPGIGGATLTAMSFIVLYSIAFGTERAPDVIMQPHDHAPSFLLVFAFIIPAVYMDLMRQHPAWVRGAVAGALWAGILYGFSSSFFEQQFQYPLQSTIIAVISSAVAGGIVSRFTIQCSSSPNHYDSIHLSDASGDQGRPPWQMP